MAQDSFFKKFFFSGQSFNFFFIAFMQFLKIQNSIAMMFLLPGGIRTRAICSSGGQDYHCTMPPRAAKEDTITFM
jgi:hypothetical protein